VRSEFLNGFLSIGSLRHQLHVILSVDESGDPLTEKRVVIHWALHRIEMIRLFIRKPDREEQTFAPRLDQPGADRQNL